MATRLRSADMVAAAKAEFEADSPPDSGCGRQQEKAAAREELDDPACTCPCQRFATPSRDVDA